MTTAQIKARIATLEHMQACMTSAAPLREKAAIASKIRALMAMLG